MEDFNQLVELIGNCEDMKAIQYATEQVEVSFDENTQFDTKHKLYNILSDKTFDVFIKEHPKKKPAKVVKKKTTAKKKVVKKKKTTTKKK